MRTGLTITAALTLIPTAALAHPGIGDAHGFAHGLAHPLGGLDMTKVRERASVALPQLLQLVKEKRS